MRKTHVVFAGAASLGVLAAVLDFVLAPSLDLLSINSTGLLVLSSLAVVALALAGVRAKPVRNGRSYRVRRPEADMRRLVRGASEGYVSNRRSIAKMVTGAAVAKLDQGRRPLSEQEVEGHLREVLGRSYIPVVIAPETESRTRVPPADGYLAALKEGISLLEKDLGA